MSRKKNKQVPQVQAVQNVAPPAVANGLNDALMGFGNMSFGEAIDQADTLFKSNRWYLISNMRQLLSETYVEHGLIQTIVNVPVDDGLRGGIEIKSKQLATAQIEDLQIQLEREDILNSVVGQASKWNRLFGGAGILIMTDQDPKQPFSIAAIRPDSPLEFRAVDMWEMFFQQQNLPNVQLDGAKEDFEFYDYYGQKVHRTRVMRMKGMTAPSFIKPRLRGWGLSVVEGLIRSVNQFLKSNNLAFEVLDEFKIDVYGFKGLAQVLASANGDAKLRQRVQTTNQHKNYNHAIVKDADDTYDQKSLSFAGLADIMKEIRMQIACDMRMPLTKIFGISASGFNSGEDDIENYNAMVESEVRSKIKFEILKILELMCQKKFGFVPDDLQVNFKSLRMMTSVEEENVKTQKFARLSQAQAAGLITAEEFREACNKDGLLPVQLDTSLDVLDLGGAGEDGEDTDEDEGESDAPSKDKKKEDA